MALVVLLRGINVGGHRVCRPKLLAQELGAFDVVNIGAAGTFVVRNPGSRAHLRAALRARLPATTQFVLCEGRDLLRLVAMPPFDESPPEAGIVRFVSFLAEAGRARPPLPITIPPGSEWFVRVTYVTNRLAVGEYRRRLKTIGYLGELDTVFGTVVTTRSWNTVSAVVRALETGGAHRGRS
jgi:uncharacterized protein (DUF1697 family)